MRNWTSFFEKNRNPHLVVGSTCSLKQWRDGIVLRLVRAQRPAGQFAFRRDLDAERARYLVCVAFEKESDAKTLANALGAETAADHPGYASRHGFAFDSEAVKKAHVALKQLKSDRRSSPH